MNKVVPELMLTFPRAYPDVPLEFNFYCPELPRATIDVITSELSAITVELVGQVAALQAYQKVLEMLQDIRDNDAKRGGVLFTISNKVNYYLKKCM